MEIELSPTTYMPLMFFKFFGLCFVVLPSTFGYGTPNGAVEPGSILRPPEFWHSANNKFTIGFHSIGNGNNQMYVVGIAYSGIRGNPTLVWTAGGGGGIKVSGQSSLYFQNNGNLVLEDEDEFAKILWETKTGESGVVSAVLEDNGNFVLKNKNFSNVWDTFSNPTDTLVVGQGLGVGKRLEMSPYSLTLESYGNVTLKWRDNITYWNVGASTESSLTMTASLSSEGLFSISNSSGSQLWVSRSSDYTDNSITLRRIKLEPDGNLRSYGWHEGFGSWRVGWNAVEDQCLVYGWCGNFGMCVYNETGPYCTCPSANFVPVDPKDPMQGCKREQDIEIEQCSNNQSLLELQHTEFLSFPPESDDIYAGLYDCEQNCLKSASCIAATILNDGSGKCRFKTTNFTTAYQSITIPSISYIKVCGEPRPLPSPIVTATTSSRSSKVSVAGIAVAVIGTLLALVIIEIAFWWLLCRNNPKFQGISAQYTLLEYASGAPVQFSYDELKRTTRNFKQKVGSGGFGTVYKGTLPNRRLVAVKKLEGIEQGDKQFRMEVATISSTHHLNLVRLIGFCSEGRHRLLVYEFMKNTSLDTFLFASSEQAQKLEWDTRLNIALGTARGIAYLHEECRDCIIHCDIKPENILLDDNLNARVSDFGLAKLNNVRDHRNHTLTSIRGTRGYLAPEWLANLPITSKSDVFSYGMVLLEIISGKRNFDISDSSGRRKFSTWAFEEFERGNIMNIVDDKLGGQINMEQVERAIRVSFWCIQEQPSQRPSMGKVVKMLEGLLPIEKPPAPKPFEGLQSSASINCSVSASGSMISVLAASAPPASSSSSADVFLS